MHDCGLCVNPGYPYLGASPDSIVFDEGNCGIIKIKCSFTVRDMGIEESLSLLGFLLGREKCQNWFKKTSCILLPNTRTTANHLSRFL